MIIMRYNKFRLHIDRWFLCKLKTLFFTICLLSFFGVTSTYAQKVQLQEKTEPFVEGEVYIKIKDEVEIQKSKSPSDVDINKFLFFNAKIKEEFGVNAMEASFYFAKSERVRRIYRLKFQQTDKVDDLIKELRESNEIEYVEKIPIYELAFTPDDLGSVPPYDSLSQNFLHLINAQGAWDLSTGDPNVVVAIVDNAIQTDHPDLIANMIPGRDVADDDSDPNPPDAGFSHGTHVAGIAGATTNNGIGVASIGFGISIMPVKATTDVDSLGNPCYYCITHGYEGVAWAADNGADIINCSWGRNGPNSGGSNEAEEDVINAAYDQGAIIVAASGNIHYTCKNYPAGYDNVFSVVNTNPIDRPYTGLSIGGAYPCAYNDNDCSNINTCYGAFNVGPSYGDWVDICAPGFQLRSTIPFDDYGRKTGTSMASPLVAGLCGLVLSANPNLSRAEVLDCITFSAVDIDPLNPGYEGLLGAGRIDAYQAILCALDLEPEPEPCCEAFLNHTGPKLCSISPNAIDYAHKIAFYHADELVSGEMICLSPGFEADATIYKNLFLARINDCVYENVKLSDAFISKSLDVTNYPNPFERYTEIEYTTIAEVPVTLFISDISGRNISTIIVNQVKHIGTHKISFDGNDLPSGIYYCTIQAGDHIETQKMVIAK